MRRILPLVVLGFLLMLSSACADGIVEFDEPHEVAIHFQRGFSGDVVAVRLDRVEVYRDTMSTNPFLGLAGIASVPFKKSRQLVRVTVNDGPSTELMVRSSTAAAVLVRYDRTTDIVEVSTATEAPMYW